MEISALDGLRKADDIISRNITKQEALGKGLLAQDVLAQFRTLTEHAGLLIYCHDSKIRELEPSKINIDLGVQHFKSVAKLSFLKRFYSSLERVASHLREDDDTAERLVERYMSYLLQLKEYLKTNLGLSILSNISDYPLDLDNLSKQYYEIVQVKLSAPAEKVSTDRFYVYKTKAIYIKGHLFYEITFIPANDHATKFDRILAYSQELIFSNYAIKATWEEKPIQLLGVNTSIKIIRSWQVAIRGCEMRHFLELLRISENFDVSSLEYRQLMTEMTNNWLKLSDLLDYSKEAFETFLAKISEGTKAQPISDALRKCYEIWHSNLPGKNILRYLLHSLNNDLIKCQRIHENWKNEKLLNESTRISSYCLRFEEMPFCYCPLGHKTSLLDLIDCFGSSGFEAEIFEREMTIISNKKRSLYIDGRSLADFGWSKEVEAFNEESKKKGLLKRLEIIDGHEIVEKESEIQTVEIIRSILRQAKSGLPSNYRIETQKKIKELNLVVDDPKKEQALLGLFEDSKVALISGPAGTGKTFFINLVSSLFPDDKKLFLTSTYSALNILKRRINPTNCTFSTAKKWVSKRGQNPSCSILFIDESSTIDNLLMKKILESCTFTYLVLVGDDYQLESIDFGNWFSLLPFFLPKSAVFYLDVPHRTTNEDLLVFWNRVRHLGEGGEFSESRVNPEDDRVALQDKDALSNYSHSIDQTLFSPRAQDEAILCLNYNGPYGVNNINQLLQAKNQAGPLKRFKMLSFRKGDPIVFNDSGKYEPVLYNNLKGRILDILETDSYFIFDLIVECEITQSDIFAHSIPAQFVEKVVGGKTRIKFNIARKCDDADEDSSLLGVVPFQLAYAMTINKAQGLEFDSVKVIFPKESQEYVTKNMFYTAITRARTKLVIYWLPQTEAKIIASFERTPSLYGDACLLQKRYPDLRLANF